LSPAVAATVFIVGVGAVVAWQPWTHETRSTDLVEHNGGAADGQVDYSPAATSAAGLSRCEPRLLAAHTFGDLWDHRR
jgi:hypothetical protein